MSKKYLLLFCISFIAFRVKCQDESFSLKEVLDQLEKKYEVTFSYADDLVERIRVKSVSNESLDNDLNELSQATGLAFTKAGAGTYLVVVTSHQFCARVINNETGGPLEGAQLILNDKVTNVITNGNGYARFEGQLTFQDTIYIKYFGFETKKIAAGALRAGECPQIGLDFGKTTLREVMITSYITSGIDFSKEDNSILIKTNDLALLPGETDGDILMALKTLPGISSPDGKAGNLHTRGSTTDQTLVLFDNIPIYHKGHYFGTISPYNPIAVDQVKVYRSGYGPDLGGRVGGAIKLESDKNLPDSLLFGIGLNTYYGSAFADIPIGKKLGINASIRSTYSGEWHSPKLNALDDIALQNSIASRAEENPSQEVLKNSFTFQDANLNANYKVKDGNVSLSFLTIDNSQKIRMLDNTLNSVREANTDLDNNGLNIDWSEYWGQKLNTTMSATYSDYKVALLIKENPANQPSFTPNQFEQSIKDLSLNTEGNILLNRDNNSSLNLGYEVNRHAIDGLTYSNRPGVPEVSINQKNEAYLHAFFVNHQITLFDKLSIKSGIRSSYYTPLKYFRIEPRVFLNWQLKNNLSFKSSYGLYSQYIMQNVYFDFEDTRIENLVWELASDEKPVEKSAQWMLGSTWKPGDFLLDVEFYQKSISDLSTLKTGKAPTDPDRFTIGDLDIYGVDVLLRKRWNKVDTWISYSYSHTSMDFPGINLIPFETYYDQPHTFNINATFPYRSWSFSIGWQYQSGVPVYTNNTFFPTPGEPTGSPTEEPVTAQKNEGRFPAQHQMDMAVVYKFPRRPKTWNGSVGLSFLNVYGHNNMVAENYLTFGPNTSLSQRYAIGFAPDIMVTIRW